MRRPSRLYTFFVVAALVFTVVVVLTADLDADTIRTLCEVWLGISICGLVDSLWRPS